MQEKDKVLTVDGLSVSFTQYEKGLRRRTIPAIKDLSLNVGRGEMVAVVGSSGSGKSLLAHAVLGILPYNAGMEGILTYDGIPLTPELQKKLRGNEIVLVPQSVSYLDPLMKVGSQLKKKDNGRVRQVLSRYGLGPETEQLYPFELSGGMARRVLIASAVLSKPQLVIADEPTPGLHLDTARRVLSHFRELADDGAGVLLITHDLELALCVADRVVVLYAGVTIEEAGATDFRQPETLRHPYSRALYQAMPCNGFKPILGTQPLAGQVPEGCPFRPRCRMVCGQCKEEVSYRQVNGGRVRCIFPYETSAGEREI